MFGSAKSSTIDSGLQYADLGLAAGQVDGGPLEGLSPGACPNNCQNTEHRPTLPTVHSPQTLATPEGPALSREHLPPRFHDNRNQMPETKPEQEPGLLKLAGRFLWHRLSGWGPRKVLALLGGAEPCPPCLKLLDLATGCTARPQAWIGHLPAG